MKETLCGEELLWTKKAKRVQLKKVAFIDELIPDYCDIGETNYQKILIEKHKKINIVSIAGFDYDEDSIPGKWGTIFCLECLEHATNQLFFMQSLSNALNENGILYLSTPHRPKWAWSDYHYNEIDKKRIHWLFNDKRVNLKI